MSGEGISTESIGVITAFVVGLTKIIQAGVGDRVGKPGAMAIALGLSVLGVALWAFSLASLPDRTWAFGLAQAVVICAMTSIGIFSATQAVSDAAKNKKS